MITGLVKADGKIKKLADCEFDELVRHFTNHALTEFVENGGKGLHNAIYDCASSMVKWRQERDKK